MWWLGSSLHKLRKKHEEHKIRLDSELFDCINLNIINGITRIDFDDLWVTDKYMEDVGCPDKFNDIPEDVIMN